MKVLSFEAVGNPAKPALIMMHGFMSSNLQWVYNKQALAEHYYLVMVEMWDHGDSPESQCMEEHSPDAYEEQLLRLYSELNIRRAALLGQSLGAAILIHFAQRHPDLVDAILFTNSKVVVTDMSQSFKKMSERTEGMFERLFEEGFFESEEKQLSFRHKLPMHPINARRMPEAIKAEFVRVADQVPFECVRNGQQLALGLCCYQHLGELSMPVLVVNGMFEKDIQPHIAKLMEDFPSFKVVDISAGHNVNLDAADKFNEVVLNFLEQHYVPEVAPQAIESDLEEEPV